VFCSHQLYVAKDDSGQKPDFCSDKRTTLRVYTSSHPGMIAMALVHVAEMADGYENFHIDDAFTMQRSGRIW